MFCLFDYLCFNLCVDECLTIDAASVCDGVFCLTLCIFILNCLLETALRDASYQKEWHRMN